MKNCVMREACSSSDIDKTMEERVINCVNTICNNIRTDLFPYIDFRTVILLDFLKYLRDIQRGNWTPDWTDDNEKWCIKMEEEKLVIKKHFSSRRFLSFETWNDADFFLKQFSNLIYIIKDFI